MFQEIFKKITEKLEEDDEVRESTLKVSRHAVRLSQGAVRSIHRGDFGTAKESLKEVQKEIQEIAKNIETRSPRLYYKGYVTIMHQEFVEASLLLALMDEKEEVQGPEALHVSYYDYLSGLGDLVGELRRHALDSMREDDFKEAQRSLSLMELIFEFLITIDYPEGLIPGIRRKTDIARGLIERTKNDIAYFHHGHKLVSSMNRLLEKL